MVAIALAMPILSGKTDAWRAAIAELNGPRRAEFAAARERQGIRRQRQWLQSSPVGDIEIIILETDDVAHAFGAIATSEEPFDRWFRAFVLDCFGLDLSQPMPGPLPEMVVDLP